MSSYEGLCPDCRQIECDEACMKATSNVYLLTLPLRLRHPRDLADHVQTYARANIAHATAAKDAEIEALRAEVDALRSRLEDAIRDGLNEHLRAERLAEALRDYFDDPHADAEATLRKLAALHPTAAQEGK